MKRNMKKWQSLFFTAVLCGTIVSCSPDEVTDGYALSETTMDAGFVATKTDAAGNYYSFDSNQTGLSHFWDVGEGRYLGRSVENVFFPDAGTYDIVHEVHGKGGIDKFISTQRIVVPTSDLAAGNLVQGGKFANAEDHSKWTILNISGTATHWTMNAGSATITGGSGSQQGIYQAIEVEGGKKYKVDMIVSGSGATNTWFEVYVSKTAPTQNSDYSADDTRIGLNTWNGCGNNPFNGKLSVIGCAGSGNTITFPTSGTAYLVIKSGGDNLGTTGITIKDVSFRGSAN